MSNTIMTSPRTRRVASGLAIVAVLWSVIPLIWMLITAFKPQNAIRTSTPEFLFAPTLVNFQNLFSGGNSVGPFIVNSVIVSVVSTIIAVGLGVVAGYGLCHWKSRGKKDLAFWIISTRMAPIAAVIVPLFVMFRQVGLIDNLLGLIVAYLTFNLPFAIWLMSAFFAEVPPSLQEAAQIDGCNKWQAFRLVVVPTTIPGIIATAVLCLVFAWNDYAFASSFAGPSSQTLPMTAGSLITQTGVDWGQLCALGLITVLPMIVVGLAVRKHLATGLSMGAVTGE
ncbi:carbohydrate ABC transporter permease [Arthrobacter wenxiniae]|jgi:multiple sugar transport system permease protein|uniref:Carbohydrate ABC transporter permease n=1 Tax=Arthrobacter wenxiniae TaxID=2713570 RepID=A0A7Y7M089_9MICC|nr:carbohydrate ABC transporter permease [Arthrobacter wenxiniae]NVM95483.1 carbohydrate ABC transporter permease [Arthrobacter wenxiniae]